MLSKAETDIILKDLNAEIADSNSKKKPLPAYLGGPALTVKELIDKLSAIDDKTLPVFLEGYVPIEDVFDCGNHIEIKEFGY